MSWDKTTLGKISTSIQTGPFGSQLHQSDYSEDGIPVVMPKDLIGGKISTESIARVSAEHVERLSRHKIIPGDILYSRRGDVGRCAFSTEREKGWLCGTGCLRVTIDSRLAVPHFVFYQLQTKKSIGWVEKHAVGATMLNLNTSILNNVPIVLPSLRTQQYIVDILSVYDALIENNQKQIKLLEEAAQRLYKEWFIDLRFPGHENTPIVDGVPKGWEKKRLVDLADVQYGFAFDGSLFNSNRNGMPIVRIRNIPSGLTQDYTTETADNQYIVKNGEIVVGMDGKFHINSWGGDDAYLVQRTCCIRPKDKKMNGWLLWAIQDPIKFFEKTVVGATVAHLGKKHIDTITLFVAPNDSFYAPFFAFFNKRQTLLNQNCRLVYARDRLLSKLIKKEIEV